MLTLPALAPTWSDNLEKLQLQIRGTVLVPEDARYDEARKAWNLTIDQRPAVIVLANSAADVVAAVRFARAEGLGIAIQSTGHGIARPADDGLLIITSRMTNVRVDVQSRTAWVEAGVQWGMVLEKAQAVDLAPLLGSSPHVGVMGYTLGGGMGWLARKYGLAIDSVRHFEVVTADGLLRRVSQTENSDLFWALRGGGGNFGVVTGMEIQLYPVSTIFGGNLIFPADQAKAVYTLYREWIASAPEELTSSIALMNLPPLPQIPGLLRGKSVVMVRGAYAGPVEQGEALVKFWLERRTPIVNTFRAMPFAEVASISNDPIDPSPSFSTSVWLRELTDEAIDTLIQYGVNRNGSSPLVFAEIRHAGGAIARIDKQTNAYGNRDASLILQLVGVAPTSEALQKLRQYTSEVRRALQPNLTGGVYLNFTVAEEAREHTQKAYTPENYRRLTALKAKYDPDNLFRFSFDIPPAVAGAK